MPRHVLSVVLLIASFSLITGCSGNHPPERATGPTFSLLTYNVNFGGPEPDTAVKAIVDADADVVCLQETQQEWEDSIRKSPLAQKYGTIEFQHAPAAGGMAILSKLPVRNLQF